MWWRILTELRLHRPGFGLLGLHHCLTIVKMPNQNSKDQFVEELGTKIHNLKSHSKAHRANLSQFS